MDNLVNVLFQMIDSVGYNLLTPIIINGGLILSLAQIITLRVFALGCFDITNIEAMCLLAGFLFCIYHILDKVVEVDNG